MGRTAEHTARNEHDIELSGLLRAHRIPNGTTRLVTSTTISRVTRRTLGGVNPDFS